jgi:HTH-type transcriptional regulator/antitoxin HigA
VTATLIDERTYGRLLRSALPVVIESDQEYEWMLARVEALLEKDDEEVSAEDGRLLKLLAILVEEYEDRNMALPRSKPHKMLKHLLEEHELKPRDLWPVIGSKSRVSEILAGKRSISKDHAKKLAAFFRVPVDLFV